MAAILGRNFVLPDDVKRVAPAVLTHRLILRPESRLRKVTAGRDRRRDPGRDPGADAGGRSARVMKWFLGATLLLVVALVFHLGLLAYAMYVLLGVMLVEPVPGPHVGRASGRPRASAIG